MGVTFRPPCLAKHKGKPRDVMIELAPVPIGLTKPRRLSDQSWRPIYDEDATLAIR